LSFGNKSSSRIGGHLANGQRPALIRAAHFIPPQIPRLLPS
jgi:hypothetical protein